MKTWLLILVCPLLAPAAEIDDLNNEISSVTAETANVQTDFQRLKDDTNLSKSILLTAGVIQASAGNIVSIDFTLIPGIFMPTGIQAQVVVPPGFTLDSILIGPAAEAASKTIAVSSTTFIISGLNQTIMGKGVVATATFETSLALFKQPCSIGLVHPFATDANGFALPISVVSGTVEIQ